MPRSRDELLATLLPWLATPNTELISGSRPVYFVRSEEHTSELQSPCNLVCRLLLEKKNRNINRCIHRPQKHTKDHTYNNDGHECYNNPATLTYVNYTARHADSRPKDQSLHPATTCI